MEIHTLTTFARGNFLDLPIALFALRFRCCPDFGLLPAQSVRAEMQMIEEVCRTARKKEESCMKTASP